VPVQNQNGWKLRIGTALIRFFRLVPAACDFGLARPVRNHHDLLGTSIDPDDSAIIRASNPAVSLWLRSPSAKI
jgi:hypothetical protein